MKGRTRLIRFGGSTNILSAVGTGAVWMSGGDACVVLAHRGPFPARHPIVVGTHLGFCPGFACLLVDIVCFLARHLL